MCSLLTDGSACGQACLDWTQVPCGGPALAAPASMVYAPPLSASLLFGRNAELNRSETWLWDGVSWGLCATGGPSPRTGHAMAYDAARNQVVLFGGALNPGNSAETW